MLFSYLQRVPFSPVVCALAVSACLSGPSFAQDRELVLVSQNDGVLGNADSEDAEVSGDGRWVLFETEASNLVEGDDNDEEDLFLFDLQTRELQLVSRTPGGNVGNDSTSNIATGREGSILSTNGRFVVFRSRATDLTADTDSNNTLDVFRYDRLSRTNTLVSRAQGGGTGNGESNEPQMSADGSTVVFQSSATDLTANVDSNNSDDVFLWDGTDLTLISQTPGGEASAVLSFNPRLSRDGNWVSFLSGDLSVVTGGGTDNNGNGNDLLLWSRVSGDSVLVTEASGGGGSANDSTDDPGTLSADGRYLTFASSASNLTADADGNGAIDVFLYDRVLDQLTLISEAAGGGTTADGRSQLPFISADGNWIAFVSDAADLVPGDGVGDLNKVYLYERATGDLTRISSTPLGDVPNGFASDPEINGDGSLITFRSGATDLVDATDSNGDDSDWFLYERGPDRVTLVSLSPSTGESGSPGRCDDPRISINGLTVTAECDAEDLVDADGNGFRDLFAFTLVEFLGGSADSQQPARPIPAMDRRLLATMILVLLALGLVGLRRL